VIYESEAGPVASFFDRSLRVGTSSFYMKTETATLQKVFIFFIHIGDSVKTKLSCSERK
jgi:hypothetical protein